jgi:Zn-dependent membrane protease YugP
MFYLIFLLFLFASWFISHKLQTKIEAYSKIPNSLGLSGSEIAKRMLSDHGIFDVKIISVDGNLADHYNPVDKSINLSNQVYYGRSVASASIAAHECGHAVQHMQAYSFLKLRSSLVPFVSISSNYLQWILLIGVLTIAVFPAILGIGIILFALTTFFSFITLPVEYDASDRALRWLEKTGLTTGDGYRMAKDALNWAARTYVVAALASLTSLLHYVSLFLGGRNRS